MIAQKDRNMIVHPPWTVNSQINKMFPEVGSCDVLHVGRSLNNLMFYCNMQGAIKTHHMELICDGRASYLRLDLLVP